jgi:hypothetical protein
MNWRRFLRREAADADQQGELEFYVDVTAEEYIERGMNPEAARAVARRKLGNMTLIREEIKTAGASPGRSRRAYSPTRLRLAALRQNVPSTR